MSRVFHRNAVRMMQTLYRTVELKSTQSYVNTAFTYCVRAYVRPQTSKLASLAIRYEHAPL